MMKLPVLLKREVPSPEDTPPKSGSSLWKKRLLRKRVLIPAVACVVASITMHDAMGVRHETGEQAKVLNQMIDQWIEVSEKNAPFLQNMHLKEMVGHTPLQVVAGFLVGLVVGLLYQLGL